jgi:hypothetical protein
MATIKEVNDYIEFLAQPVKVNNKIDSKPATVIDGTRIASTVPGAYNEPEVLDETYVTRKYYITKTGIKVNPRSILESVVRKYGLDSSKIRRASQAEMLGNEDTKYQDILIEDWLKIIKSIPAMYTIDQLPLIIDGQEVRIEDNIGGKQKIKELSFRDGISIREPDNFGEALDRIRTMSGDEPATNNMIARIGLGVLCVGGIALLVQRSRKNIS